MDSAADDLMTASIGRSPRNDPDPPGPHQADFHGLPLDHATNPASNGSHTTHSALLSIKCVLHPSELSVQWCTRSSSTKSSVLVSADRRVKHLVPSAKAGPRHLVLSAEHLVR